MTWELLHPEALWGLLAIPVVVWLTRRRPPTPAPLPFPAFDLLPAIPSQPPQRPPLWRILLRVAIIIALCLGLAAPQRRPATVAAASLPLQLLIDDSWAAAPDWADRLRQAERAVAALEADAPVTLVRTAPGDGFGARAYTAAAVRTTLRRLSPKPWPADHASVALAVTPHRTLWISDGIGQPSTPDLIARLRAMGPVAIYAPAPPLLRVADVTPAAQGLAVTVQRRGDAAQARVALVTPQGAQLAEGTARFAPSATRARLILPAPRHPDPTRLDVVAGDAPHAGAVLAVDHSVMRPRVHLAGPASSAPLQDQDILFKALSPNTMVRRVAVHAASTDRPNAIVLADTRLSPREVQALSSYLLSGGVVVRFAGPVLARQPDALTPAPLAAGWRALDGQVSWSRPQGLAPFAASSPLADLRPPADLQVRRQVMFAHPPGPDVDIWARLTDGTPLISHAQRGAGHVILIHTSAGSNGSDLPLAALFPTLLGRLTAVGMPLGHVTLGAPYCTLTTQRGSDGQRQTTRPLVVEHTRLDQPASPTAPPGLYLCGQVPRAHGVLPPAASLPPLPAVAQTLLIRDATAPGPRQDHHLQILLLAVAALLGVIDALMRRRVPGHVLVLLAAFGLMSPAWAQDTPAETFNDTRLGWISSGDAARDRVAADGLTALSRAMTARTTATLLAPRRVDGDLRTLALYPLVYWPVSTTTPTPTAELAAALATYMRTGGMLWIDVGDDLDAASERLLLTRLLADIGPPPLVALGRSHVIYKTFYLLSECPGALPASALWLERRDSAAQLDGVASLLVGRGDWARAWAGAPHVADRARSDAATRCGINIAMYALVGHYKADQIHARDLIERLQRRGDRP